MTGKVTCPSCEAENYATDATCMSCGTQLGGQAQPPPQQPGAPAAPQPGPPAPPQPGAPAPPPMAARPPGAAVPPAQAPPRQAAKPSTPWYLYLIAVLPIGIPVLTLGGAIWGALGFGLAGANVKIMQHHQMPVAGRIAISLGLTVVGYGIVIALGLAVLILGRD